MALKRLNTEHYLAINELALPKSRRKTIAEIAELCEVSEQTIYRWKKDPTFERELKREMVRYTQDRLPDLMDALITNAIETGNAASAKLILTANDMLTDRVDVTSNTNDGGVNVEDLRARLARIKGEHNTGE